MLRRLIMKFPNFRKRVNKIIYYCKYPHKFQRDLIIKMNLKNAKKMNVNFIEPNYLFKGNFKETDTIIDVGCGYNAELAQYMIQNFNVKAIVVDPTKKHAPKIDAIKNKIGSKFEYLNIAISSENKYITFHETLEHESGSLMPTHINIKKNASRTYEVESLNLTGLLNRIGTDKIDYIKIDIEGAEYDLIKNCTKEQLEPFKQIFIEFHHHAFDNYSKEDTNNAVSEMQKKGFQSFTLDNHNYLFYKQT